jgi:hypothetical protein
MVRCGGKKAKIILLDFGVRELPPDSTSRFLWLEIAVIVILLVQINLCYIAMDS